MGFKKKYFPFNSCYPSLSQKSYLITNDILLEREREIFLVQQKRELETIL